MVVMMEPWLSCQGHRIGCGEQRAFTMSIESATAQPLLNVVMKQGEPGEAPPSHRLFVSLPLLNLMSTMGFRP